MMSILTASRRVLLALALASASLAAIVAPPARATAPPQQRTQVPGYYRMALGDFEVTALYDGYIDLDSKLLTGASASDIQRLLARMFIASPQMQTAVNAFLVHTGAHLVLIDTGIAKALGPTLGAIPDAIRAAGYDAAQIDTVLLTHLHPDHVNGLLSPDGGMAFPNAEIRVAKVESDYWLDEAVAAQAPSDVQPFFKMARDALAPYIAAGRFRPFGPGEQTLLPGVKAVPAAGHTPGHSAYLFSSAGQHLLAWGDVVHSAAVQFARPEIAIEFDIDRDQAVAARQRLFADAAREKTWIAGAHPPFPGIGHVRAEAIGYAWVPIEYAPIRSDR
jgi:glyoxylase-like metal-dependent hydrolase (beta-lactamase superfamily II)